jgi:TRAP-type C4-dicarboxylate transport system substrate-binding protein
MNFVKLDSVMRAVAGAGALVLLLVLALGAAQAQDKTYVMKIGLPTLNDPSHQYAKNFAAAIEKNSGGRIKPEIYPASQLGSIPRMIEGTQFGAIQCVIIPPDFFVGIDTRFEVMAAPGLVDTMQHAQRLAADPAVLKVMLGLGADKGLHGVSLFVNAQSAVISKSAVHRVADFKGKKIRIFASDFQFETYKRLGATPVAMTLGDVLPALQQGTIDPMRFQDAAKFVTETGQPAVFAVSEVSKKWYDSLPADLRKVIDTAGAAEAVAINPRAIEIVERTRKGWTDGGGELISLPPDEQTAMMKILSSVGADVSKSKATLNEAYRVMTDVAKRTR